MTRTWQHCKNILIIRADNMGDLIMSAPAIRALKQTFSSKITVLTSSMAAGIARNLPEIDEIIVFDLPWIKAKEVIANDAIFNIVELLKQKNFDAAVIFTVFSQNPLPAAMLTYMANIPLRLAYCRENPYELLTDWVPDKEPYTTIKHQVERDLALVETIGATSQDRLLRLPVSNTNIDSLNKKLITAGIDFNEPWIVFHAGVSEKKRKFPPSVWVDAAKKLIEEKNFQVLFSGSASEKELCEGLANATGKRSFSLAGLLELQEFIALIKQTPVLVSVNTGAIHIAAAVNTPVVVLYAQTNPQHTPWMVPNRVLEYEVDAESRSKNEVIQHLYKSIYNYPVETPGANEIFYAVIELL